MTMCCSSCTNVLGLCKPGVLRENDDLGEDSGWMLFVSFSLLELNLKGSSREEEDLHPSTILEHAMRILPVRLRSKWQAS